MQTRRAQIELNSWLAWNEIERKRKKVSERIKGELLEKVFTRMVDRKRVNKAGIWLANEKSEIKLVFHFPFVSSLSLSLSLLFSSLLDSALSSSFLVEAQFRPAATDS